MKLFDRFIKYDLDSLNVRDESYIQSFHSKYSHWLNWYFKSDVTGLNNIPDGPALYVGNHSGAMLSPDSFVFGSHVLDTCGVSEVPYALAHEMALKLPGIHETLMKMGAVRASHKNAKRIFKKGKKVLVYPGGDVDALRPYWEKNKILFAGRTGYIRLALENNVPIIPVTSTGGHDTLFILTKGDRLAKFLKLDKHIRAKVWPLSFSLPWGFTIGPPPPHIPIRSKIRVAIGEPLYFNNKKMSYTSDYITKCDETVRNEMEKMVAENIRFSEEQE